MLGVSLQHRNQLWQNLEEGAGKRCSECRVPLQHRNHLRQSLEEGCRKAMRRDKESSFESVINYGRVWRKDAEWRGLEIAMNNEYGLFFSLFFFLFFFFLFCGFERLVLRAVSRRLMVWFAII